LINVSINKNPSTFYTFIIQDINSNNGHLFGLY